MCTDQENNFTIIKLRNGDAYLYHRFLSLSVVKTVTVKSLQQGAATNFMVTLTFKPFVKNRNHKFNCSSHIKEGNGVLRLYYKTERSRKHANKDLNMSNLTQEEIFKCLLNQLPPNRCGQFNEANVNVSKGIIPYAIPIHVSVRIYMWTMTSASIIGIVGNLLVLMVYLRNCRDVTPFKFLISHLAFCDLLFSCAQLFDVGANGWYSQEDYTWKFKPQLCKLTRSSVHLSSLVSVGTILAITVERFQGIRQGIRINSRSNVWKKVVTGVCLIWLIAVCSDIPVFMSIKLVDKECQEHWEEPFGKGWTKSYSLYLLLVFCLIPMFAMTWMNGMIIFEMKKPSRSSRIYRNMLESMAKFKKRRDMRAIKILVTIIVVFFVCVLPIRIMFVVSSFHDIESEKETNAWFKIVYKGSLSYPLHVAVNPLIYSIIDRTFREDLKRILFCGCKCITDREIEVQGNDLPEEAVSPKCNLLCEFPYKKAEKKKKYFQKETNV